MTAAAENSEPAAKPVRGRPFKPGQSGNPGGRPKGLAARVREQMPEEELVAGMIRIAKGLKVAGQKPTVAEIIRAREWLADRGHGKAPIFAPIEGENPLELDDVSREVAATLDELAARREAAAAGEGEAPAVADAGQA
jgi:hypothetical protein